MQPFVTYIIDYSNSVITDIPYPTLQITLPSLSVNGVVAFIISGIFAFYILRGLESGKKPTATSNEVLDQYVRMYDARSDVNIEELTKGTKKEYWSLAITQQMASKELSPTIVRMVKAGIKFKFLFINPNPNRDGGKEPEYLKLSERGIVAGLLQDEAENSLKRFHEVVFKQLNEEERRGLEVRLYNLPLTHTMIIIDQDQPDAKIQFEAFTYYAVVGKVPVFIVEKSRRLETFQNLLKSFQIAWDRARPVEWEKL